MPPTNTETFPYIESNNKQNRPLLDPLSLSLTYLVLYFDSFVSQSSPLKLNEKQKIKALIFLKISGLASFLTGKVALL